MCKKIKTRQIRSRHCAVTWQKSKQKYENPAGFWTETQWSRLPLSPLRPQHRNLDIRCLVRCCCRTDLLLLQESVEAKLCPTGVCEGDGHKMCGRHLNRCRCWFTFTERRQDLTQAPVINGKRSEKLCFFGGVAKNQQCVSVCVHQHHIKPLLGLGKKDRRMEGITSWSASNMCPGVTAPCWRCSDMRM